MLDLTNCPSFPFLANIQDTAREMFSTHSTLFRNKPSFDLCRYRQGLICPSTSTPKQTGIVERVTTIHSDTYHQKVTHLSLLVT